MALYIGFATVVDDYFREVGAKMRSGDLQLKPFETPEPARTRARELPAKLPAGCKLHGSWIPAGGIAYKEPIVTVIETDNPSHLAWFNTYYGGMFLFTWHPYVSVPRG